MAEGAVKQRTTAERHWGVLAPMEREREGKEQAAQFTRTIWPLSVGASKRATDISASPPGKGRGKETAIAQPRNSKTVRRWETAEKSP